MLQGLGFQLGAVSFKGCMFKKTFEFSWSGVWGGVSSVWGLGFGVWGQGFRVRVWGQGFRVRVSGLGF